MNPLGVLDVIVYLVRTRISFYKREKWLIFILQFIVSMVSSGNKSGMGGKSEENEAKKREFGFINEDRMCIVMALESSM